MTILITGGAGYIGSHAVYAFREAGHEVVVLDDLSTGVRDNLPADLPLVVADVGDADAVGRALKRHRPEAVIHFAGSILVAESVENPIRYYRNNTVASLTLFEACLRHGVGKVLFSSTAAVYGVPETGVAAETDPLRPINPYGRSKLMTERILADVAARHGLGYGILRYFNVAGADPAGRTGQSSPQATHLIKIIAQVAAGLRERMAIYGTDYPTRDGTCERDYIHVADLAEAHVLAYRAMRDGDGGFAYNCGYGRGYTVREVLAAAERVIGRRLPVDEEPRRPGDPPVLVAAATAIRDALGWRPRHDDLAGIIDSAVRWERRLAERAGR